MFKLILCILIVGVTLVFVVGFVNLVHAVDDVKYGIDHNHERKRSEDQKILDWAESPTPGYDSGSHK